MSAKWKKLPSSHLGSVLSTTSRCQPDIFRQISIASSTMYSMNRVWRQTCLHCRRNSAYTRPAYCLFSCTDWKPGRSCRKIYGSSRPSICVAIVLSLECTGTILLETPRSSPTPIFPLSETLSPRGETKLAVWSCGETDDHTSAHRALSHSQVAAVRTGSCLNSSRR